MVTMAYKSAFTLFNLSKDKVLNNPIPFLLLTFMPSFLIVIADAMNGNPSKGFTSDTGSYPTEKSIPYYFVGGIMTILLFAAAVLLELKSAKNKQVRASEAFSASIPFILRIVGLILLLGIIIVLGLLAFIVPGIIFIQWFFLAPYFLVDKNMGIIEAMKASKAASRGNAGAIWSVIGVMMLLSLFGFIPIFGGFISLVLTTLYACASALRYYEITGKKPVSSKS